jgi:hypothetical protein
VTRRRTGLTLDQKETVARVTRQTYVTGIYRWLIEVAFLFAAFTEFPEHKWSIGLAVLAFGAAVGGIVHYQQALHTLENVLMDQGERKTRHAVILASELAAKGVSEIEQYNFWGEVDRRVAAEVRRDADPGARPTGFWKGLVLGAASLIWQLTASLVGIALVAALTS